MKKNASKYLFEFIVIVLGISVSFAIDEWDQNRKNKIQHIKDLQSLRNDLVNDSLMFASVQFQLDRGKKKVNELLNEIELYQARKLDYNEFTKRIINIAFPYDNKTFFMTDATFKSLISSNRIDLFPDNIHSLINDYYESIRKRINDNNHMIDDNAIKYYHDYHPFALYYVNSLVDLGFTEFKARELEINQIDKKLLPRFKKYFSYDGIKNIYTSHTFLQFTSSLKNRIHKYNNQISIYKKKRDVIAEEINRRIVEINR